MIHGINNIFLYASTKLTVKFVSSDGKSDVSFMGTGFFVKKENELYLLTNRHVLDIAYTEESRNNYPGYTLKQISFDTRKYVENGDVPRVDIHNYVLHSYELAYAETKEDDIACLYKLHVKGVVTKFDIVAIDFDMMATSEFMNNLSVCDFIAFIGFPAYAYDRLNSMPILRSGVISSDPRLDYNIETKFDGHRIAYEAFSTGGASGSPVFALQKGFPVGKGLQVSDDFYRAPKLIGINAGCIQLQQKDSEGNDIGVQHQQISYMYKADQIRNLIVNCENITIVTEEILTE